MLASPIPADEVERLASLKTLQILDTSPEIRFDRITLLATYVFKIPISTITLVDSKREWYKSCQGVLEKERDRTVSFCGHAMLSEDELFVVKDTEKDPRFADNPMVTGAPFIRFYAGVPLFSLENKRVGVFCIKDIKPRILNESEVYLLKMLASWAELELNISELTRIIKDFKSNMLKESDKDKINILINRLTQRETLENIRSIKVGINMMISGQDREKIGVTDDLLNEIEKLVFEIQDVVQ